MRRFASLACSSLAVLAVAAGCGGSTSGSTTGATGAVAGTVETGTRTGTAEASGSFSVDFNRLRQKLKGALEEVSSGDSVDAPIGAGTILETCTDTATSELGSRARTVDEQRSVSRLRTACQDASEAAAKLESGDSDAAARLARLALQQVQQAK